MQDFVVVTGMVLKTAAIGEYDRRVCLLTKERGKISAFAKGARRQNNRFMAATNPFCFGEFKLYEGRSSYNIMEATISNYFEGLREDFEGACYGMYFLEIADYYTRENNDEVQLLKLLYQTLRALSHQGLSDRLIRYIYEMKAMVVEGEFPGVPPKLALSESTIYTIQYIMTSTIEKLYTFTVTEEVLDQLKLTADYYRNRIFDSPFKSLEILEQLCGN